MKWSDSQNALLNIHMNSWALKEKKLEGETRQATTRGAMRTTLILELIFLFLIWRAMNVSESDSNRGLVDALVCEFCQLQPKHSF